MGPSPRGASQGSAAGAAVSSAVGFTPIPSFRPRGNLVANAPANASANATLGLASTSASASTDQQHVHNRTSASTPTGQEHVANSSSVAHTRLTLTQHDTGTRSTTAAISPTSTANPTTPVFHPRVPQRRTPVVPNLDLSDDSHNRQRAVALRRLLPHHSRLALATDRSLGTVATVASASPQNFKKCHAFLASIQTTKKTRMIPPTSLQKGVLAPPARTIPSSRLSVPDITPPVWSKSLLCTAGQTVGDDVKLL